MKRSITPETIDPETWDYAYRFHILSKFYDALQDTSTQRNDSVWIYPSRSILYITGTLMMASSGLVWLHDNIPGSALGAAFLLSAIAGAATGLVSPKSYATKQARQAITKADVLMQLSDEEKAEREAYIDQLRDPKNKYNNKLKNQLPPLPAQKAKTAHTLFQVCTGQTIPGSTADKLYPELLDIRAQQIRLLTDLPQWQENPEHLVELFEATISEIEDKNKLPFDTNKGIYARARHDIGLKGLIVNP